MLTEPPCFGWGISTCQFFYWVQNFYSLFQFFFFWVQNFYALFILIWDAFLLFFNFFRLFVFVFILFEHPWHAIDVFVRLRECCLKSPIILLPKKSILFYLGLFGNISGVIFKMCCGLLEECKTLKYWSIKCWWHVSSIPRGFEGEFSSLPIAYILWLRDVVW